ncbi:MAG: alpha/beta-type small acid-soluble spore protein [Christensenellales bacterium]
MARNRAIVREAKNGLDQMKFEIANELGVNLKQGYNGDLTAKQNGSVGGEMVKRMINQAKGSK